MSKSEYEALKKKLDVAQIELRESRKCNEKITMKYMKVCELLKKVSSSAATGGMNASQLKEYDQYELASIPGSQSHDVKFLKTCLLILHDRNFEEIMKLSRTGRRSLLPNERPTKKIDAGKYLIMKNLFFARARKNTTNTVELNSRLGLFESYVTIAFSHLKTQFSNEMKKSNQV